MPVEKLAGMVTTSRSQSLTTATFRFEYEDDYEVTVRTEHAL